ncbi:hypothetical protein BC629DRAFT_1530789 [Irpex lacteus]|nr:hypothetical protein BC629DRAFT_1530789 [Irpex lacteus]
MEPHEREAAPSPSTIDVRRRLQLPTIDRPPSPSAVPEVVIERAPSWLHGANKLTSELEGRGLLAQDSEMPAHLQFPHVPFSAIPRAAYAIDQRRARKGKGKGRAVSDDEETALTPELWESAPEELVDGAEEWMAEVEQEVFWPTGRPKQTMLRTKSIRIVGGADGERTTEIRQEPVEFKDTRGRRVVVRHQALQDPDVPTVRSTAIANRPRTPCPRANTPSAAAEEPSAKRLLAPIVLARAGPSPLVSPARGTKRKRSHNEARCVSAPQSSKPRLSVREMSGEEVEGRTKSGIQSLARKMKLAWQQRQQISEAKSWVEHYLKKNNAWAQKMKMLSRRRQVAEEVCVSAAMERSAREPVPIPIPGRSLQHTHTQYTGASDFQETSEFGVLPTIPTILVAETRKRTSKFKPAGRGWLPNASGSGYSKA